MKKSEYLTLLSTAKGEFYNLSFELFQIMSNEESEEDRIEAFQFLCENFGRDDSDESVEMPEHFTEEERLELKSSVAIFVDSAMRFVLQKAYRDHFTSTDFYRLLWNMVFTDGALKSEKENAFALYWILIDGYIPYVQMNEQIDICAEKANNFMNANPLLFHRVRYFMHFPLGKRTRRAALLIQELDALDSIEEKTILLAYALSESDKRYEDNNGD